jgi:leucyl-tRNA synthetase
MHTYIGKEINNKYSKKTLIENYTKILTLLEPVLPHLVNEAFKEIGESKISWPNYDKNLITEDIITFVIQINGKKRGTFEIKNNSSEKEILNKINQDDKLKKYLNEKEIKKKIFVPNRLINIII